MVVTETLSASLGVASAAPGIDFDARGLAAGRSQLRISKIALVEDVDIVEP